MIAVDLLKKVIVSQKESLLGREFGIERTALMELGKKAKTGFIIAVTGARRCGKSTLLNQFISRNLGGNYCYFNFDDDRILGFKAGDFERLIQAFNELYGDKDHFLFDEIQNVKGWELFVNRLQRENKRIIITGSNAKLLSGELATHLTGRHLDIELMPFSFTEFLKAKQFKVKKDAHFLTKEIAKLRNYFNEYLLGGGFPEAVKNKDYEILKNLYDDIIFKDIRTPKGREHSVKEIAQFMVSNISNQVSLRKIQKHFGYGSPNTVKRIIEDLSNAFLLFTIRKFSYSYKEQLINPQKVYCIDTGLASAVSIKFSEDLGQKLENLVFLELKRRKKHIYYYKNNKETDFIVVEGNKPKEAIQVCYNLTGENKGREELGLLEALKELKIKKGLILTLEHEEIIKTKNKTLEYIPVWKWLLKNSGN
ncbi:MAG: ATP-binding protein, partial [Candidatus Diapherotrites archaeon]